MRIIAGLARGMPLTVPRGDTTRPTSDRVREAIFSSLGERVVDATVLDLFAGTGALGLEAASRGARAVTFVEQNRAALIALEKNVADFVKRGGPTPTVIREDVFRFLRRSAKFDLVFADPPYGVIAQQLLSAGIAADRLVLESAKRDVLTVTAPWELVREGIYGDTRVSILKLA
jgi:16S rRNA (guanine966-N2)-methyltransferase